MNMKKAKKAGEILEKLMDEFQNMDLDPDYAAYLLMSSGFGLAMMTNRQSPIVVNQLIATAMMIANRNLLEGEDDEECVTKH